MAISMVSHELRSSKQKDKLYAALEAIGAGYRDWLESTWLVMTERTALQIRDELKQYLRPHDRLLVIRHGAVAAAGIQRRMPYLARR
jgi:hypothetical protein